PVKWKIARGYLGHPPRDIPRDLPRLLPRGRLSRGLLVVRDRTRRPAYELPVTDPSPDRTDPQAAPNQGEKIEAHTPLVATAHLPAVGGRIGSELEDFIVEELPLYEASGEGEHLYVFLEKRGATTQDLIQAVARTANVRPQDVGAAGMKDKHAITRQWLSLPATARPPEDWELPEFATLLERSRHRNKLRTGHLRANRFRITLVDVPAGGLERARAVVAELSRAGLPNYYGAQRFGRHGKTLAQALQWLRRDTSEDGARRRGGHGRHFQTKLLSSAVQSEIFNRYLTARLGCAEPLLTGEVVRLDGTGRHFVVEDVAQELPRYEQGDLHRTGPLLGPRTLQARAAAAELEARVLEGLGFGEAELATLGRAAPGARRDLTLHPEELEVEEPAPGLLVLSFGLPAGSYATQLVRELTRAPWLEPY